MQKGEKLGCFGLTEPDFGSNPGGMRTRARKVGNEYVINGEKMWITSGSIADVAIIWAKVENENDKVRGFLVETDRPGFKADDIHAIVVGRDREQGVYIPLALMIYNRNEVRHAHFSVQGAHTHCQFVPEVAHRGESHPWNAQMLAQGGGSFHVPENCLR